MTALFMLLGAAVVFAVILETNRRRYLSRWRRTKAEQEGDDGWGVGA